MNKLNLIGLTMATSLAAGNIFAAVTVMTNAPPLDLNPGDGFASFQKFTEGFAPPCTTCHQLNDKLIGPSYKEVAKKRKGEEGAVNILAEKIMSGNVDGKMVYGDVVMPPNTMVKKETARKIAEWVLSLPTD